MAASARWLLPTLLILFFVSGTSALMYQVLWLRLLALLFGVTAWAVSTVVAAFMAGLALGSFGAGRVVDRIRNPLLWFGIAEGLVGLSALATPVLLDGAHLLYASLYRLFPDSLVVLTAVRFLVSAAVLIVPTTMMGATLPIVVKSSLLRDGQLDGRLSLLYAVNTTGAVLGTLLAGFYLIGNIGIAGSFRLAVAMNVGVALAAAIAASQMRGTTMADGPEKAGPVDDPARTLPEGMRRIVLVVFALSGFTSMAQEVIWFRILVFFQQVNVYAFTVMLATFLTGIAAGSYLAAYLMRRRLEWLTLLAVCELGIAVLSVSAMTQLAFAERIVPLAVATLPLWASEQARTLIAAVIALLPITLLLGVAFPIGLRTWTLGALADAGGAGRRIGVFYSSNVFGAILGSIAAGFVLLPLWGSRVSLDLVAGLTLLGGLLLLTGVPRRRALTLAAASVSLFAAGVAFAPDPHDVINHYRFQGEQVVFRDEGIQTTVAVHRKPNGALNLLLDGFNQASNEGGGGIHWAIGRLGMMLHPRPTRALVIGMGGGATPGAQSLYPGTRLDLVELSGGVIRASEWFRSINFDVLRRPTTHLIVDDGRNHLMLSGSRYDVITADLIFPHHAGAGNLYSREYFQLAREALADDGLMVQWVAALPETEHKLVIRTFLDVFPETTLWTDGVVMVGATHPLVLSRRDVARRLGDPEVGRYLRDSGVNSPDDLLGMYWAGPDDLRRYVGPGPLLTDDRPLSEYFYALPERDPAGDLRPFRSGPGRYVVD